MLKKVLLSVLVLLGILISSAYGLYVLMNSTTYQVAGEIIPRVETDKKVIALTFDDGPSTYTNEVIAILKEKKVSATFFLIGNQIEDNMNDAKMIVQEGHQIGNHSYSHPRFIFKSTSFVEEEVEKTNSLIREAGYNGPLTFRPPYGKKIVALPQYLASKNIPTITWDVDPLQKLPPTASSQEIADFVVQNTRPGSIILLHPWYDGNGSSRAAIPVIIDQLKEEGYTFVTVNELLEWM